MADHSVALQSKTRIVCACGQVFDNDYGKSPAPILGATSDYYLRTSASTLYARHLRHVRALEAAEVLTPEPDDRADAPGTGDA